MENLKSIEEKIVQTVTGLYNTYLSHYVSVYFDWLSDLLSGTQPFTVLAVSIFFLFVMMVYIWFRSRNY